MQPSGSDDDDVAGYLAPHRRDLRAAEPKLRALPDRLGRLFPQHKPKVDMEQRPVLAQHDVFQVPIAHPQDVGEDDVRGEGLKEALLRRLDVPSCPQRFRWHPEKNAQPRWQRVSRRRLVPLLSMRYCRME